VGREGDTSDRNGDGGDDNHSDEKGEMNRGSNCDDDDNGSDEREESADVDGVSGSDEEAFGADAANDDRGAAATTVVLRRSAALARVDMTLLGAVCDVCAAFFAVTLDGTLGGLAVPPPWPPPAAIPSTAAGGGDKRGRDGGSAAASPPPPATRADHLRAAARHGFFAAAAGLIGWLPLPAAASTTDSPYRNVRIAITGGGEPPSRVSVTTTFGHQSCSPEAVRSHH